MPYSFQPEDATIAAGFRRIAAAEIATATAALHGAGPLDGRIHEIRKSLKKLRALLRLVRPEFRSFRRENRALRDIGRGLAGLRDGAVTLRLLDRLADAAQLGPADRAALAAALGLAEPDPAAERRALAAAGDDLAALGARAARWEIGRGGFGSLAAGLSDSWTAARKAMPPALKQGAAEAVHDWRKRVKDHWYHARLLAAIWPEAMAVHTAAADTLGELLGEHHDLAVLAGQLDGAEPEAAAAALLACARQRRTAILAAAGPLGRRLFAEDADRLADRWKVWWKQSALPQV